MTMCRTIINKYHTLTMIIHEMCRCLVLLSPSPIQRLRFGTMASLWAVRAVRGGRGAAARVRVRHATSYRDLPESPEM